MMQVQPAPRIAVPDAVDPSTLRSFDRNARVIQLDGKTMGTTWQVRAALSAALPLTTAELQALIEARLDSIVRDMSHWDQASSLSRFNLSPAGSVFALSADFARVMTAAVAIAEASGGAFDPAIGRLTDRWSLGPNRYHHAPDQPGIRQALARSDWRQLSFNHQQSTLQQPGGVWLDLSGIAKGFAVDAVVDLLAEMDVRHCLVEIGGECIGRGLRPDGDPWWVDIENPPHANLRGIRLALHQLAVATSGDYLRGAHSVDPQTGQLAIHATSAVTVIHSSCMHADAWATALGVAQPPLARSLARNHDIAVRIVERDGTEWLSDRLCAMIAEPETAHR